MIGKIESNEFGEHFLVIDDIGDDFEIANEERIRWNVLPNKTVEILYVDEHIELGYN